MESHSSEYSSSSGSPEPPPEEGGEEKEKEGHFKLRTTWEAEKTTSTTTWEATQRPKLIQITTLTYLDKEKATHFPHKEKRKEEEEEEDSESESSSEEEDGVPIEVTVMPEEKTERKKCKKPHRNPFPHINPFLSIADKIEKQATKNNVLINCFPNDSINNHIEWKSPSALPHQPQLNDADMKTLRDTWPYLQKRLIADFEAIFHSFYLKENNSSGKASSRHKLKGLVGDSSAEELESKFDTFISVFQNTIQGVDQMCLIAPQKSSDSNTESDFSHIQKNDLKEILSLLEKYICRVLCKEKGSPHPVEEARPCNSWAKAFNEFQKYT